MLDIDVDVHFIHRR